ncbi:conserved membrane hypothetical protein [Candidatus Sulfotelmatobacter kueseliae]|uniref:Uncharacterized protein n=1 Tax=Candidatus Sulfotelmatobacter kueseliae TaxID=2042962 RepID=A0A2U3KE10_9BACT|nr:conserved membrane hypothetical protein [Candidatus Sulfotelmatobacter kueseliae]
MLRIPDWIRHRAVIAALWSAVVAASVLRIVATYPNTAQAYDEPGHVAAGIEFLDKGTYTLDPVHPPLAPTAIALPLYLAGARYPVLPESDPASHDYNVVGNRILYDGGNLAHNLALARTGVLPFFILGAVVVFLWARHFASPAAALFATFLYCTTPTILAFSSVAYTDMVAASTQLAAMFAFSLWLESPSRNAAARLALALGAAFLAKLTSFLFIPAAALLMTIVWLVRSKGKGDLLLRKRLLQLAAIVLLLPLMIWAGYFFSLHRVQAITGITPSNMASWQHFPGPVRSVGRELILRNPRFPAGEFFHGVAAAWVLNKEKSESYLLGHTKVGGWWYFFLLAIAVKSPIPLLLLAGLGLHSIGSYSTQPPTSGCRWIRLLPAAALAAVLLVTMHVSYQAGLRHILVALPLLAIIAGVGASQVFQMIRRPWRLGLTALVIALLSWQLAESIKAQADSLAYFNEFAGSDPSSVLVIGCDLDCGQDLNRLAGELRSRHIDDLELAIFTSADTDRSGLPHHELPDPARRPQGWIAVSARPRRTGSGIREILPLDYFAGLEAYRVANVGKTIRLYYVPATDPGSPRPPGTDSTR